MADSMAPGETLKLGRDECKLIIQVRIKIPQPLIDEISPHDKIALTALRTVLDNGLRLSLINDLTNNYFKKVNHNIINVEDITVDVTR